MKTIKYSSQFKKDFKKYRNDKAKVESKTSTLQMWKDRHKEEKSKI